MPADFICYTATTSTCRKHAQLTFCSGNVSTIASFNYISIFLPWHPLKWKLPRALINFWRHTRNVFRRWKIEVSYTNPRGDAVNTSTRNLTHFTDLILTKLFLNLKNTSATHWCTYNSREVFETAGSRQLPHHFKILASKSRFN